MKIKILYLLSSLGHAGLENELMRFYKFLDKNIFDIDFCVTSISNTFFKDMITKDNNKIYILNSRNKRPLSYSISLYKLLKQNNYDIVHIHQNSASLCLDAFVAKLANVRVIIGHSHNANCIKKIEHHFMKLFVNFFVTDRFACSKEAGEFVFEKKHNITVIHNALNPSDYTFDMNIRNSFRESMNIDEKKVIVYTGRLHESKNIIRMIDVFNEILKIDDTYILLIVGDGPLKDKISQKIIGNTNIFLLGYRDDINRILFGSDIFILMSKYEGVSNSRIEALISGLPCIVSDKVPLDFSNEIINTKVVSLKASNEIWAKEIMSMYNVNRLTVSQDVIDCFDIEKETKKLQGLYIETYNNHLH